MSAHRDDRSRTWLPQRWVLWGFIVGVAVTVPATFFALLFHTGEALHPYLVPSTELLAPLSHVVATWPGLVNVAIVAVVNGVIYAAVAGALGTLLSILRHRYPLGDPASRSTVRDIGTYSIAAERSASTAGRRETCGDKDSGSDRRGDHEDQAVGPIAGNLAA